MSPVAARALLVLAVVAAPGAGAAPFEQPVAPLISEILPADLRQSVHHSVDEAFIDGRFYRFRVTSQFGVHDVPTVALLRIRVAEIATLAQAFGTLAPAQDTRPAEMPGQYSVRADSALDILTRPGSAATEIAGQVGRNLDETLGGSRSVQTPTAAVDYLYMDLDPVSAMHMRNAAAQWGLDLYSSNPNVQEFLHAVARARSAGRISAGAPSALPRVQQRLAMEDPAIDAAVASEIKSWSTEELANANAALLASMRIPPDVAGAFLRQPALSPRHRTRIVHYLQALDGVRNRAVLLEAAAESPDESVALAFEQAAMLLLHYHRNVAPLQQIHARSGVLQAIAGDRRLLNVLPVDVVFWSAPTARLFDSVQDQIRQSGYREWELATAGVVSTRAREELRRRGFVVRANYPD